LGFISERYMDNVLQRKLSIPFGIYQESSALSTNLHFLAFNPFWDLSSRGWRWGEL